MAALCHDARCVLHVYAYRKAQVVMHLTKPTLAPHQIIQSPGGLQALLQALAHVAFTEGSSTQLINRLATYILGVLGQVAKESDKSRVSSRTIATRGTHPDACVAS